MAVDLAELGKVGGEFARHVLPLDVVRRVQDPRGFVVRVGRPEVAEQPCPEPFRLADVEHPAGGVGHSVDTGPVLRQGPDPFPERPEVRRRQRESKRAVASHDWQR